MLNPRLLGPLIYLDVLAGGVGPGEVLGHAVAYQGLPNFLVAIESQRRLQRLRQSVAGVRLELESRALPGLRIKLFDGVVESADRAHNRHGAIAQAVDLVHAAGFVMRRHEEHVATGFDLVRQRVVVGDLHAKLLGILFVQLPEHLFVGGLAGAEHRHNQVGAGQAVGYLLHQIEALLRNEAGDDANHWQPRVFCDAERLQQVTFAFGFAGKVFDRVRSSNVLVVFGTPLAVVHAVQDPGDGAGAGAQSAFQAKAILRRLDLQAISPADRGDEVGGGDRALQEIHLAVEFHLRHGEQVPGQHEQRQYLGRKQSLITQVMNGEDGRDVGERWVLGVKRLSQYGNQGCLPVVAVKDVGHAEDLRGLQHRAREQREPLGVVVIVAQRCAIERVAVEVWRIVDEIELHSSAHAAIKHGTEAVTVIERNGDAGDDLAGIVELGLPVTRKVDGDLVAQAGESGRQGANDICQPAGLGKRYALGCRKSDMHETSRRGGC